MNPPLTPHSILRQHPPPTNHLSSSLSSLTSTEATLDPPSSSHHLSSEDEGDDERDSLLIPPQSPFGGGGHQSNLHHSFTSTASTSTSNGGAGSAARPLHPPRRPTSLSFTTAPPSPTTRPSGPRRTQTTSDSLLQEGEGDGYGTFGSPSASGTGTRRRTWLGGSSSGGTGRESSSRAERIKRRLEVTASVIGLRKAVSYDDVGFSISDLHPEGGGGRGGREGGTCVELRRQTRSRESLS